MITLAMTHVKGGTGKSTTAINLAVAAALRGLRSVVVDTDPQGSARQWACRRTVDDLDLAVVEATPDRVQDCIKQFADRADVCLIDTPGHDWRALSCAAVAVNLSLIVTRPAAFDLESAQKVGAAYKQIGLPSAILITQVAPRTSQKSAAWAEAYARLGLLVSQPLAYRAAFQDSIALGLGVNEYEPHGRAAAEVDAVVDWILAYFQEQH